MSTFCFFFKDKFPIFLSRWQDTEDFVLEKITAGTS